MAARTYRFTFGPWNISTGRRPVRPAGPQGGRLRRQDPRVQEARLRRRAVPRRRRRAGRPVDADPRRRRRRPRSRRCSTARACSASSSPRGCGSTPRRSTAATPPTAPPSASTPSSAPSAPSTSPTPWAASDIVLWLAREGTYIREAKDPIAVGRAHPRRRQRPARARQEHPHPRRDEAERADGPGVPADAGPLPGAVLPDRRPVARGRADRVGPLDPGRPRPVRRHGLRPVAQASCGASTSTTRTG